MRCFIALLVVLCVAAGVSAQDAAKDEKAPAVKEAKKPTGEKAEPENLEQEVVKAQLGKQADVRIEPSSEVELVERVAKARKEYTIALKALKDFYMKRGDAYKVQWVTTEMTDLGKVEMFRYLDVSDLAGSGLKPKARIPAADQLFKEGVHYKNYPEFPPTKKDKLKIALKKFETIIRRYPDSDKVDDAAFRMGEIYGGWYFKDYTRAVKFYRRCWQWNPNTKHPARFYAAKVYDEKLKNRDKAVELYNKVIAESSNPTHIKHARDRIIDLSRKK